METSQSLKAAIEINSMWAACFGGLTFKLANCPSNEQVAEVIEKHMKPAAAKGE